MALTDNRQTSQFRLRDNSLKSFGLSKGAVATVLHTQRVPYGALACVRHRGDPLIGLYCPGDCGCAYLRQGKRTWKLAAGSYTLLGLVVRD